MVWVGVSYGGVRSLVVVVRVRVCPALYLEVYGAEPGFGIEKLGAVCVPLPKHAGRSLLRHPKIRSQNLDGGSAVKVVHQLGRAVRH
jgi:hypothetical protein